MGQSNDAECTELVTNSKALLLGMWGSVPPRGNLRSAAGLRDRARAPGICLSVCLNLSRAGQTRRSWWTTTESTPLFFEGSTG